jgi:hypothetical protein
VSRFSAVQGSLEAEGNPFIPRASPFIPRASPFIPRAVEGRSAEGRARAEDRSATRPLDCSRGERVGLRPLDSARGERGGLRPLDSARGERVGLRPLDCSRGERGLRLSLLPLLLLAACSGGTVTDGGIPSSDAGDSGTTIDAGPRFASDAGIPDFTAATFCEVFARTSCRWSVACGKRTAPEEADCVLALRHLCPRPLKFDATAAAVCLLRLESARCGEHADRCDEAWPPAVPDGGVCINDSECLATVCALDGGCGICAPPLAPGASCDGTWPCDKNNRCADGDGGILCRAKLAEGVNCVGLGDTACASGRCKLGKCASAAPGSACTTTASCPVGLYCDPIRSICRVPLAVGDTCDNQPACASKGAACLGGKCVKVPAFSLAEGATCTETAQCAWGLSCDVRVGSPTCVRRIETGADCELKSLDVWDPHCRYLELCHPVTATCTDSTSLCTFATYCPMGPGPGEACKSGAICRGQSACVDPGDGGFRCLPNFALPAEPCFDGFGTEACFDSTCMGGTCAPWTVGPTCS